MLGFNRQNVEIIGHDLTFNEHLVGFEQLILANADFDGYLPICCRTDLDVVIWTTINALTVELNCGSSRRNHRNVRVSSDSLTACRP